MKSKFQALNSYDDFSAFAGLDPIVFHGIEVVRLSHAPALAGIFFFLDGVLGSRVRSARSLQACSVNAMGRGLLYHQ